MALARRAVLAAVSDVAGADLPLDLDLVKKKLFIAHDDDDDTLNGHIASAFTYLHGPAGVLGRCVSRQTWDERFERFPCTGKPFELAMSPVTEVASVKYFDTSGVEQTLSPADYETASDGDLMLVRTFDAWPSIDTRRMFPIVVRYTAGFETPPSTVIDAMMLHVGALYENRGITPLELQKLGYFDLIAGHRRPSL